MECEASRAARGKFRNKVVSLAKENKNKEPQNKDKYYFQGENFYVNGQLQEDVVTPPTYTDIIDAIVNKQAELADIHLFESVLPLTQDGNSFTAYFARVTNLQEVRLAYIKVYKKHAEAASVMMAYKLTAMTHGSCNDNEYNTGFKLLKLLHARKLHNAVIFIAHHSTGQHLGAACFQLIQDTASALLNGRIHRWATTCIPDHIAVYTWLGSLQPR